MNDAAPSAWTIENVMAVARSAAQRIQEEDGEIITDEAELLAALAAEGADVLTIIRRLVRATLDAKANGEAADKRAADLRSRRERFKRHEETWRNTVREIMTALGMKKLADPEFTASISSSAPRPVVVDEDAIPSAYWREKREIDLATINAAMKQGASIPGIAMSNGGAPILTLRSK